MDARGVELGGKFVSLSDLFDWLSELPKDSLLILKNLVSNELYMRNHGAE